MALLKLISGLLSIDTGKFLAYASSQTPREKVVQSWKNQFYQKDSGDKMI